MRNRAMLAVLFVMPLAACAGGSGATPSLVYAVPATPEVTYVAGDTLTIAIQGLPQAMEIGARTVASYRVRYQGASGGLSVTASIESLSAELVTPMTEPMTMDGTALEGDFTFELDGRGRVGSMSSPTATDAGGQVFGAAAPLLAYSLFPRLPGRAVSVGDSWMDTLTYTQTTDAGQTELVSELTYTVLDERQMTGRTLLDIGFEGTADVAQELVVEGATISLTAETEVVGSLRWDAAAGLLYDSELTMEGPGSAQVALLPTTLPTRTTWRTTIQLQDRN